MKPSPCRDCKERRQGCHAECLKYGAWAEDVKEANKRKRDDLLPFRHLSEGRKKRAQRYLTHRPK